MISSPTPIRDGRDAAAFFAALEQRLAAFTPELAQASAGGVTALLRVLAQYLGVTVARLNQAPQKNFLAFLEMLGIDALPPQPARAPSYSRRCRPAWTAPSRPARAPERTFKAAPSP